uniref:FAS1 domain-containing protein n=1 Tax=Octopus bimaculoides TaxID=37653 RepID=A0A0L8G828_OCTBM
MINHNSTDAYFTAFSPNDSYLNSMPNFAKNLLYSNKTLLQNFSVSMCMRVYICICDV